jgi:hypothetical protein
VEWGDKGRRKNTREERGALARMDVCLAVVSYHFTIVAVRYRSTDVGKDSGAHHPLLS